MMPNELPEVTAVLCAYNPPAIWETVVQRLAAHGLPTIIVDDGSAPPLKVPTNCALLARVLRSEANIGLGAARNLAIEQLETGWILFVDADVLPSDEFLAGLRIRLAGSELVDGFGFHVREHHRETDWDFYRAFERDAFTAHGEVEWVSGLLCAYRVEALRTAGGFDLAFRTNGEDVDLGYRLTRAGKKLVQIPEICGEHYRKDSLGSFLRMHHRYALTAKRVDRSHYFATTNRRSLPLFHLASVWPTVRLMLNVVRSRPRAFYLPPLVLAVTVAGAVAGRKAARG